MLYEQFPLCHKTEIEFFICHSAYLFRHYNGFSTDVSCAQTSVELQSLADAGKVL